MANKTQHTLFRREIVLVLLLKLLLLFVLWGVFFAPGDHPETSPAAVSDAILSAHPAVSSQPDQTKGAVRL